MRGDITINLLQHIKDFSSNMVDLTAAFLSAGYGASVNEMWHEFDRRQHRKAVREQTNAEIKKIKQRFYAMLNKLEKDGLIIQHKGQSRVNFSITSKGKRKITELKDRQKNALLVPRYDKQKSGHFTLVIFDIPEKERKKRKWLRAVLQHLEFQMLQKSVWMGQVKIPADFIQDLKELKLLNYVEIFEISKGGSLQQVV